MTTADTMTATAPEATTSIRDTISAAFESSGISDVSSTKPEPKKESVPQSVSTSEPTKEEASQTPNLSDSSSSPHEEKQEEANAAPDSKSEETKPAKPPQSWKPEVREKFSTLPPDVQQEVIRREREIDHKLKETADLRKFSVQMLEAIRPFETFLRTSNTSASQAFTGMMTTAYNLQTGTPRQKAEIVAKIINNYGVDINQLADTIEGRAQPPQDARYSQLEQQLQQMQAAMAQQQLAPQMYVQQQADQDVASFAADPKNEFFDDVREDMAALLQANRAKSLQDAYDMAIHARPDIRKIINSRTNSVPLKQNASSSVSGAPTQGRTNSVSVKNPSDLRSVIEAAMGGGMGRL